MFGESPSSDANGDGFAQLFIGRMFPFFQVSYSCRSLSFDVCVSLYFSDGKLKIYWVEQEFFLL